MRSFLRCTFLVLVLLPAGRLSLHADCGATTFQPISPFVPPGTTHAAYFLTDPAGQQRAVFDLHWGGALASLTYLGTESVWGNATGGMVQPAPHDLIGTEDYNPTQSGDVHNLGTVTSGVRCVGANVLYVMSGALLDYNTGQSGHIVADSVRGGSVVAGSYATPYYVVTLASFVKNPMGTPAYYLRLQQTFSNVDPNELIFWGFDLAGYVPYDFSFTAQDPTNCVAATPCAAPTTPQLVAGLYPTASLQGGTAFYISPAVYWKNQRQNGTAFAGFGTDNVNQIQSAQLFSANWGLAPGHSRTFVYFVLVGSGSSALAFATNSNPPLSFFTVTPCRALDTRATHQTLTSDTPVTFPVAGTCGIPANAVSVALNVTAVTATANVDLVVYPGDQASPPLANVVSANTTLNPTIASNAVVPLAANGTGTVAVAATFATPGSVDLLLDVTGYFLP
jgi:hypothetical protein